MVDWSARLGMPVSFASIWGEFAHEESIFAHEEFCRGLTPPDEILARAAGAATGMPDYERIITLMALEHSLEQLPATFRHAKPGV